MTDLLLKVFVKDTADMKNASARASVGMLSGAVGIVCNILLFALKLFIGTVAGSVSVTADAMNNLSDATSSIVTLIGFRLAKMPADEDHPYGHARYEYLSGLAVAAMIIVIGFELAKTSVGKIIEPSAVELSVPACIALVGSVAVKLWLCIFNRKLGKTISSSALLATSADSRNDAVATTAVLLAGITELVFHIQIDGFMGLLVALFILYSGVTLAKDTISPLLGENASPELKELIIGVMRTCPEVLGYHDLMVHDYGPGQRFASIHVEMDHKADPLYCHELIDTLERNCLEEHNIHLVIHYDPVVTGDEELDRLRHIVTELLRAQDDRISIHDFRMVKGEKQTNLIFDIALPSDLMPKRKEVKSKLDSCLAVIDDMTYYTVVDFDMVTFNEDLH
ncbi:MAG: cation transporter [Ruminococcaceae bacterium]|nr:cation transporter [Oscillospiraceae bacterium]